MAEVEVYREIDQLRNRLKQIRQRDQTVALVPTMGALHAGHAELLRVARANAAVVVASIFVNPIQFDRKADFDSYPLTFEQDLQVCAECGTDLVFAPSSAEFYPSEPLTFVESPELSRNLCGAFRPGHFRGVATVVLKLFNVVQPDVACFGEKDAQQLAVIRRMVTDLNVPVTIIPVATVREADGLALSSRNKHLSETERMVAPALYDALRASVAELDRGERRAEAIKAAALHRLRSAGVDRVEYFEIVDPDTLSPLAEVGERALLAAAIWLGSTRLIDNTSWPASLATHTGASAISQ